MSNEIAVKQNEEEFIQYLAAQRQLYDEEKRWNSVWMILVMIIAILGSGSLAFLIPMTPYITVGAFIIMGGEFTFLALLNKRREDAARIQELFDCKLLDLPWNEYLAKKPDKDIIRAAANRHREQVSPEYFNKLHDWYPKKVADMPIHIARVICQQENLLWDEKQRREYVRWVGVVILIAIFLLIIISIAANWTVREFLSGAVLIMLPVFYEGIKHIYGHVRAISRLSELSQHATNLIGEASQADADADKMLQKSRKLQDQIFEHRTKNPPVYTWVYNLLRDKYEKQMQAP